LTASGGGGDWFGWATSIDGNTAVIGAPGENSGCGSAYIFKRVSNSWVQAARLTASDAAGGDWFAEVVSVSGNTVVMGASYDDDYGTSSFHAATLNLYSPGLAGSIDWAMPMNSSFGLSSPKMLILSQL
jgi:hypothetical protein